MSDSLRVELAVDNSFVVSGAPVQVYAKLTDTSTTPRPWTINSGNVTAPAGTPMDGGTFGPGNGTLTVPPGGSITLTAGIVFYFGQQGADVPLVAQYDISADFLDEDGVSASGTGPQITIAVATVDDPSPPPVDGELDFRSNLRSGYLGAHTF